MATVRFVCLHNAGRSQMSAALFDRAADGRHHALSAGSEADPAGRVHPPSSRSCASSGSTCLSDARNGSQPSWLPRRTWWSRWAAATRARSSRASAISTGSYRTPEAVRLTRSAERAIRSPTSSDSSSTSSTTQPSPKPNARRWFNARGTPPLGSSTLPRRRVPRRSARQPRHRSRSRRTRSRRSLAGDFHLCRRESTTSGLLLFDTAVSHRRAWRRSPVFRADDSLHRFRGPDGSHHASSFPSRVVTAVMLTPNGGTGGRPRAGWPLHPRLGAV
jgi:Low molecular weight phosphotyrosine protein phosphatase